MKARARRRWAGVALVLVGLVGTAAHAAAETSTPPVVSLELRGVVDGFVADYLTGSIQRAQDAGAAAVLIQIDTPGGLDSSMREITQGILNATVPVICYVSPSGARAASAGAFILESCPVAAMAPGTNVGASTPVGLNGGDLATKIQNDAASYMRSLAQRYGRNADVAETFVTQGASITAEEALQQDVIDLISPTVEQLLSDVDGRQVTTGSGQTVTLATAGAPIQEESMGGFVGFLHALFDPSLAFVFFWLGLGLIVLELIVPGHIFSGTLGTILLLISLWSFGLLPVRIIGLVLLVVSVICFVVELKAPGLGIWGALGVASLLLGGWFLYDRSGGVQVSPVALVLMALFAAGFFGLVVAKVLQIRHVPPAQSSTSIIGREGVALGAGVDARGGIVRVSAEEWQARADPAVPGGAKIRVTGLDGLVLTVELASAEHATTGDAAPAQEGGTTP